MLRTYLTLAIRQMRKHPLYSSINILGLSAGIAVVLVLGTYIRFETSWDSFHEKAGNLYMINSNLYWESFDAFAAYDLGPLMKESIPGVKNIARRHWGSGELSVKDGSLKTQTGGVWYADNSFFKMFSYKPVAGDLSKSLTSPYSIVLSKTLAATLFKDPKDALGKTLSFKGDMMTADLTVTAVAEDVPANSTMGFNALISIDPVIQSPTYQKDPRYANFFTYVELEDKDALKRVEEALPRLIDEYIAGQNVPYKPEIFLQPVTWGHLSNADPRQGQDLGNIYIFSVIAIIVLATAWVNYINLSTARAIERAREVGVKKALGVQRKNLITQFLCESFVVNAISVTIATGLAYTFMPLMSLLAQQDLHLDFTDPLLPGAIVSLLLFGTLISGLYPAFVLSSFRTTEVIQGINASQPNGFSLRKTLIVFQFTTSLCLLIATTAIIQQVWFMEDQDTGVEMQQVLVVNGQNLFESKDTERMKSFKSSLQKLPSVASVATSSVIPGGNYSMDVHMDVVGTPEQNTVFGSNTMLINSDMDFIDTYQFKVQAGHKWDQNNGQDYERVLINESTVSAFNMGTNRDAIGKNIVFNHADTFEVIGVVENFYWESLKVGHRPIVLFPLEIHPRRISILLTGDFEKTIEAVRAKYEEHFPGTDFNYYFANDFYNRLYQADVRFGQIFGVFSIFAIGVACLGLFGMATFITYQRAREISIRKVLGASVVSVMTLISTQFGKLMLIAIMLAIPLSWAIINNWLENYPVRIGISAWLFVVPSIALLLLLAASVIVQVYRGASVNPAKVLRG